MSYLEFAKEYELPTTVKEAIEDGNLPAVFVLLGNGYYIEDLNAYSAIAAYEGHLKIVEYMYNLGADDLGEILFYAVEGNSLDIVEYIVECGVDGDMNAVKLAIQESALHGYHDIFHYLDEKFPGLVEKVFRDADEKRDYNLVHSIGKLLF